MASFCFTIQTTHTVPERNQKLSSPSGYNCKRKIKVLCHRATQIKTNGCAWGRLEQTKVIIIDVRGNYGEALLIGDGNTLL